MYPFEIADDNAAGVAENIRDEEELFVLAENLVGFVGGRAVGGFGEDAALQLANVPLGDLAFERGRDENVALQFNQLLVCQSLAVAFVLAEVAGFGGVVDHGVHVEPFRVVETAGVIAD